MDLAPSISKRNTHTMRAFESAGLFTNTNCRLLEAGKGTKTFITGGPVLVNVVVVVVVFAKSLRNQDANLLGDFIVNFRRSSRQSGNHE